MATPVSGVATITGTVDVSPTTIDFHNTFTVPATTPPPMETGAFAGLSGANAGTIQSLSGPATGTVNIPDFVIFTGGLVTPVHFDLTSIPLGFGTVGGCSSDTVGSECTLPGSPFTLIQSASNSVSAYLELDGKAYTGTPSTGNTPYTLGSFTTQSNVVGYQTITEIVAVLLGGGSISGETYSATFSSTAPSGVPEPASMLLMGIGLLGAGLIARRKIRS